MLTKHRLDMGELLRDCSFTTTSFDPSATTASVTNIQGTASPTTPAATNSQSTNAQSSGAQSSGASQTSTITNVPGLPTSSDAVSQQSETGAAPLPTVGAVGFGLGVVGFAMGLL